MELDNGKTNMRAKRLLLSLIILALLAAAILYQRGQLKQPNESSTALAPHSLEANEHPATAIPDSAALFHRPNADEWAQLQRLPMSLTAADVEQTLRSVYALSDVWQQWIELTADQLRVKTSHEPHEEAWLNVKLATSAVASPPAMGAEPHAQSGRWWRKASELPPVVGDQVLAGLKIAIDPGHIGGKWATMEERRFVVDGGKPVAEGDMTLQVALLLKEQLTALGASVQLLRSTAEPTTTWRPQTILDALQQEPQPLFQRAETVDAEKLFYRTAEIHARAARVNREIQPDLVLCLHFDAVAWGNPDHPSLVDVNHLHLIVHGAYTDDEWAEPDQRYAMIRKILTGVNAEEIALSQAVAATMAETTQLPAYTYDPKSNRARNIGGNPYIWARNLLANRLYECPVVYLEPYVMNSHEVYQRVQRGDYLGQELVAGKLRRSIYREYADGVTAGLLRYYRTARQSQSAGR